jgi:endonuclease YncB( thermonuclease family)
MNRQDFQDQYEAEIAHKNEEDVWTWVTINLALDEEVAEAEPSPFLIFVFRAFIILVFVLGLYGQLARADAGELQGRVVGVTDGDTITLLIGREQHRVRLAGIDAPEQSQAFGQRSKQALSQLCYGDTAARVRIEDRDRYGRIVGRVFCRGEDANAAQVQRGYAWVYTRYNRDHALPRLERVARTARMGLWADPAPIAPWDFRRQGRS